MPVPRPRTVPSAAGAPPHPPTAAGGPAEAVRGVGLPAQASAPGVRPSRRLSPRWRKAIVAAHLLVGVGWLGVTAGKLVLELVTATTADPSVARSGYAFMAAFDRAVFPPMALATLITGIVLSVGTAWGLFRH